MAKACQMYINGQWVDAIDGKTFDDYNPYNGEVYTSIPSGIKKRC